MASVNRVTIIGNCGRDVELRYTKAGDPVADVSVAVSEKSKNGTHTEWFNVSFFGKTAEVASKYLSKGAPCYVEGRQRSEKYTDKSGVDRVSVKLICDRLQLLGGRDDSDRGDDDRGSSQRPASTPSRGGYAPRPEPVEDFEDDIPF